MPFVIRADGNKRTVKNLGWLLRHSVDVESLSIDTDILSLTAHMSNGDRFVSRWVDKIVLFNWINRPAFYGLPVILDGYEYTIQPVKKNPNPKLNRYQKDLLVDILKGVEVWTQHYENDNIMELIGLGYIEVNEYGDAYELTVSGKEIAESESQLKEQARKKRNAAARGRSAALAGLGMKRTKYGWE
jgi:hypothetical protein